MSRTRVYRNQKNLFTWLFVNKFIPLMTFTSTSLLSSCKINFFVFEYRVCCTVAPNKESTRLPNSPANIPHATVSKSRCPAASRRHWPFSKISVIPVSSPTSAPPTIEAVVPTMDIAPFVPGGTGLRVVIKSGLDFDRIPSSDARVSPRQQAKCLVGDDA